MWFALGLLVGVVAGLVVGVIVVSLALREAASRIR